MAMQLRHLKGPIIIIILVLVMIVFQIKGSCQLQPSTSATTWNDGVEHQQAGSAVAPRSAEAMPQYSFKTAGEMKQMMRLPCNYVHDGFYLHQSNEILHQVYHSLLEMDDSVVPLMIEVGGHDGITKSISLKASICLEMNVLLIEASPPNFNILKRSRSYDTTVNAALCNQEFALIAENTANTGETHIGENGKYK